MSIHYLARAVVRICFTASTIHGPERGIVRWSKIEL